MPKTLYQCPECGLHYEDAAIARRCQAWCSEHKSCNLEITKASVEDQRLAEERQERDESQSSAKRDMQ